MYLYNTIDAFDFGLHFFRTYEEIHFLINAALTYWKVAKIFITSSHMSGKPS